jgi:hypothetical protein
LLPDVTSLGVRLPSPIAMGEGLGVRDLVGRGVSARISRQRIQD